jgi:hypothetical protein
MRLPDHPYPPCGKTCRNRKVGCHSTCEKYKQYKNEIEEIQSIKAAEALGTPLRTSRIDAYMVGIRKGQKDYKNGIRKVNAYERDELKGRNSQ